MCLVGEFETLNTLQEELLLLFTEENSSTMYENPYVWPT